MDNLALRTLLSCDGKDLEKASKSLMRIFDNLLRTHDQKDSKFRRLNISSDSFLENVISVPGALDILFEIGFQEDPASNEHLIFPFGTSLTKLERVRNQIAAASTSKNGSEVKEAAISSPSIRKQDVSSPLNKNGPSSGMPMPAIAQTCSTKDTNIQRSGQSIDQKNFRSMLISYTKQVQRYEDGRLQGVIRSTVPISRLKKMALDLSGQNDDFNSSNPSKKEAMIKSYFLFVLLRWFKEEFFQWVNNPKCDRCSGETVPLPIFPSNQQLMHPTPEEVHGNASKVELYQCQSCRSIVRFPRYNDPLKLLSTRRGRCGEWANCFTAICRAVGFEARYVQDNADHVWTEVFSELDRRWLHCDSCETALDQPLMYEVGWGKKLAYILAFSRDEITDVSCRYSADHGELRKRRSRFTEIWLMNVIQKLNDNLQLKLQDERKSMLRKRQFEELVEFLSPNNVKDSEKVGRISGSLTWRLSRGEIGRNPPKQPFIIIPTQAEVEKKILTLRYISSTDTYRRGKEEIQGFESMTFKSENIIRKTEPDWKMAYLARTPNSITAEISWKFQCTETVLIRDLLIRSPRATFETGQVTISVIIDGQKTDNSITEYYIRNFGDSENQVKLSQTVEITATLSHGNGQNAWQHTQLFRESLNNPGENSLEIEIHFN